MAKKTITQLIDDLDESLIQDGQGKTVKISLDDERVEIDLSNDHIQELRDALAPFFDAGRAVGVRRAQVARETTPSRTAELQKIREWARANGHAISDRGRISGDIVKAFKEAN